MASTYTVNLGIEKIGTGEQSGTWGDTTNTNFDLIDQAVNGAVTVTLASAGTSGVPNTLAITDGAASNGRNKFIEFNDGGDLGATAYVQLTPNDAEKLVHIRNSLSGGRTLILFQGTYNASNDFEIPNGKDVVLKFDGGGASATVTQVFEDLLVTAVAATTIDTTNIEVTNLKAKDGTAAGSIADSTGVVTIASSVLTTTDINGGSVDGVTLGTNSAVTEAQIDNININGNTISSTDTNGNVTITPDGTGSVAITKIDVAGGEIDGTAIGANSASTGAFTTLNATGGGALTGTWTDLGSVTTVDINGGNIDGTVIGAATPAAGSFTTITGSDDLNIDSGTFFVDASANAVGIGTSSPAQKLHVNGGDVLISITNPVGASLIFENSAADQFSADKNYHEIDFITSTTSSETTGGFARIRAGQEVSGGDNRSFLGFWTAPDDGTATEKVRITSAGNVGIGTASPNSYANLKTLTINGTNGSVADFEVNGTLSGEIFAESNSLKIDAVGASGVLKLLTNSAERMRITSAGNVGIGTASPSKKFHVLGTGSAAGILLESDDATNGQMAFKNTTNTAGFFVGISGSASGDAILYQAAAKDMVFYTSGSERMRIDSSGNVGIGAQSPSSKLHVNGGDGNNIRYQGATHTVAMGITSTDPFVGSLTNGPLRFLINASERARLDVSGNLLVGTTDTTPFDSSTEQGTVISDGQVQIAGTSTPLYVNRQASAGDLINMRYNGAEVGSIGTSSGDLTIGTNDVSLRFSDGANAIFAVDSSGASRDAATDLGFSSIRFKDLYLSGGVVFGSTGGAVTSKTLDDYEEGTWTPTYELGTIDFSSVTYDVQIGKYTKIGNVVYCQVTIRTDALTVGSGSGSALISGLPFTVSGGSYASAKPGRYANWAEAPGGINCETGANHAYLIDEGTTGALTSAAFNTGANSNLIDLTFFYYT